MAHFLADLLILGFLIFWIRPLLPPSHPVGILLRMGLFLVGVIGSVTTVLGYAGLLHSYAITGGLAIGAMVCLGLNRHRVFKIKGNQVFVFDWSPLRESGPAWSLQRSPWSFSEKILAGFLIVFLLLTLLGTLFHVPLEYDSLSYRLPRIGWWLQEGSLWQPDLVDSRMNFMPALADLHMLWVTGHWNEGFPGTALPQWCAGIMLLLATYGLVRVERGSRLAGLVAVWLILALAPAAAQFCTDQTDLFTAGLFASGLFLFRAGLEEGRLDPWAALAFGLSFASKPTVLFAIPGLLLWGICFWWWKGRPCAKLVPFAFCGLITVGILAGPRMLENRLRYGSYLSSPEISKDFLRPELTWDGWWLNFRTSALQMAIPGPLPAVVAEPLATFVESQAVLLPQDDADQVPNVTRATYLKTLARLDQFETDTAPPGMVNLLSPLCAFVFGCVFFRKLSGGQRVAVFVGLLSSGLFVVAFLALSRWHPYWFRFLIVPSPWLAVGTALALDRGGAVVGMVRSFLGLGGVVSALVTWGNCRESGWQNLTNGQRSEITYEMVSNLYARVLRDLHAKDPVPTVLLQPFDSISAGFFRAETGVPVRFAPAKAWTDPLLTPESLVGPEGGWVISPRARFETFTPRGLAVGFGPMFDRYDCVAYRVGPGAPALRPWIRKCNFAWEGNSLLVFHELHSPRQISFECLVDNPNPMRLVLEGLPDGLPLYLEPGKTVRIPLKIGPDVRLPLMLRLHTKEAGSALAAPFLVPHFVFPDFQGFISHNTP